MNTPGHLRIDQIKLPPGQEWSDDAKAWRFLSLCRGAAYWLDTAKPRAFNEGELVIVPPRKKALVRASQLSEVLLHGFSFAPDLLCGFFTVAERYFFENDTDAAREAQFLPSTHPLSQKLAALAGRHNPGQELAERAEVLGLAMTFFGEGLARHRAPETRIVSAQHRFQQIIFQMPDFELIHHTPEQLARLCGCSPRHFNRLFREHFGEAPRTRQTELRLLKARQLLSGSDTKIIQVALDSGYRSLSLFNALFKRRFGMSPSQWRQKGAKSKKVLSLVAGLGVWLASSAVAANPSPLPITAALHAGSSEGLIAHSMTPFFLLSAEVPFSSLPAATTDTDAQRKAREALRRKLEQLRTEDQTNRHAAKTAPDTNTVPKAPASTNGPTFEVKGYELIGNTVLPPAITEPILEAHTGKAINLDSIRQALAELQLAYRDRGYVTVVPSLPPQQLTNGIVMIKVTEGRLVAINVLNNHYFSSNNVMRELPNLHTNMLLNALLFQEELDRANANRDRQIYPVLGPGPDPGTSILDLKVKDRLPIHAHVDLNDYSTPGTPELRANFAVVDDNLWQLNHQIGLQYSFSPESYKQGDFNFYEQPQIANYSAYYRMPLSGANGPPRAQDYTLTDFGYNEATRRFQAPPPTGASELLFYASRSSADTGQQLQSSTLTPPILPPEGGLQISDTIFNRTINPNEDLGARFSTPLAPFWGISSTLSGGVDYKNYRSTLLQDRTFQATIFVPDIGTTGPPFTQFPSPAISTSRTVFTSVRYMPFSLSWEGTEIDPSGTTTFSLGQSFAFGSWLSSQQDFAAVAGSTQATGNYYVMTPGITREQKIYGDWGVRLHADGQWANEPLISNEQMAFGGLAGPRGYRDGAVYGDNGWRVQAEPHSPYWNVGLAFDRIPMVIRTYTFLDYGQSYLIDSGSRQGSVDMLGVGAGFDLSIGEHFDARVNAGVPLLRVPTQEPDHLRIEFSIGTQW